jgi:hypothetical protein
VRRRGTSPRRDQQFSSQLSCVLGQMSNPSWLRAGLSQRPISPPIYSAPPWCLWTASITPGSEPNLPRVGGSAS